MFTRINAYLGLAITTFLKRKVHFFLSVLGILVGMITLTIVLTITEGNKIQIQKTMESMGTDLIWLQFPLGISLQDAYRLKAISEFESVAPLNSTICRYNSGKYVLIYGIDENYFKIKHYKLNSGRLLHHLDVVCQKQVAVVEGSYNEATVDLSNERFKIIGGVELKYANDDVHGSTIYIPITLVHSPVYKLFIKMKKKGDMLVKTKDVITRVKIMFPGVEFTASCAEALIKTTKQVNNLIMSLALMLTGLILLTGGVGIMNVLIISVKERTREIGLRKALGATSQDILLQFLIEGTLITFISGSVGLIVGLICAYTLSRFTISLPVAINSMMLFTSIFILLLVSVFFSFYPALKASKMSPAEALTGQY